ncbi:methylesterase 3-like [Benincasa hispida]|uniref:methylesterase 3-like n=1 Tax=Benincasa hispida TaxID=102211 RepID=UPI001900FE48|nr:methylesterase 3-like [Benincasa hispida]
MMDSVYSYGDGPNRPPTAFVFGPRFLASKVYQLSPPEDLTLATLLMRPVSLFGEKDITDELKLSEKNYGSVKRVFVMSEKDLVGNRDFQRWMIEKNPPDRVVEIEGSDHMVMMSKPLELWAHLELIAQYYP